MFNISINLQLPRIQEDKNKLLLRSALGCSIGLLGKVTVSVLTGASLTTLSLSGWGVVGLILGLASCFFEIKRAGAAAAPVIPNNPQLINQSNRTWNHWIAKQLTEHVDYKQMIQNANLTFKNDDTFDMIWAPTIWAPAIIAFTQETHPNPNNHLECWTFTQNHLGEFTNYLVDLKAGKKELRSFQDSNPRFFESYLRISSITKEIQGGKRGREEFETMMNTYLDFIVNTLSPAPVG